MVNFLTRIPVCDSRSPAILDLFLSSDSFICSIMDFPAPRHFDYVVVQSNSKWGVLFHRIAYDQSYADQDGLCDHWRDFPWKDIFKLSIYTAASEFFGWVQVEINVYIPQCKYDIKSHSLFSCLCCCHSLQKLLFLFVSTE